MMEIIENRKFNHLLPIKSKSSPHKSLLRFVNKTDRKVEVSWVNYVGNAFAYGDLEPGSNFPIDTYYTHYWVFKDLSTGEPMHVNGLDAYMAKPYFRVENGQLFLTRKNIDIYLPLTTLKNKSLWLIAPRIKNANAINELEIPNTIKEEMIDIYEKHQYHVTLNRNPT